MKDPAAGVSDVRAGLESVVTANAFVHGHWAKMQAKAVLGCVKTNKGKSHLKWSWGDLPGGPVVMLLKGMHGGLAACHSKASKQASLVEMKVYFISGAGNWGGGWWTFVQRPASQLSPTSRG